MKLKVKLLSAIAMGVGVGIFSNTVSCNKKSEQIKTTVKTPSGKDSVVYVNSKDCPACGMG